MDRDSAVVRVAAYQERVYRTAHPFVQNLVEAWGRDRVPQAPHRKTGPVWRILPASTARGGTRCPVECTNWTYSERYPQSR